MDKILQACLLHKSKHHVLGKIRSLRFRFAEINLGYSSVCTYVRTYIQYVLPQFGFRRNTICLNGFKKVFVS